MHALPSVKLNDLDLTLDPGCWLGSVGTQSADRALARAHGPGSLKTHASFDDPDLVSHAGLVPVMALAERTGLPGLVAEHVRPGGECGVNASLKVPCLVAGMAAGADSIDDMDMLRHGAMGALFGGVRAPSTLGSHLRAYTWGNVAQLEKAGREFLAELARLAPLLPGAETLAFIDIDSMQKRRGHKKQGAKFGHTKIQGNRCWSGA